MCHRRRVEKRGTLHVTQGGRPRRKFFASNTGRSTRKVLYI